MSRFQQLQQASRDRRPSGVAPDEGGAAPNLDGKKQVASTSMTGSKNGNNGIGIGIDMSGGKLTTASASAPGGGGGSRASPVTPPPPAPPTTTTNGSADEVLDNETILANVEEMLEGFEWRGGDIGGGGALMGSRGGNAGGGGRKGRSKADEMERRLISELKALEAVRSVLSLCLFFPLSLSLSPYAITLSPSLALLPSTPPPRDTSSKLADSCHVIAHRTANTNEEAARC